MKETNNAKHLTAEQKKFVVTLIDSWMGENRNETNITESSGNGNTDDKDNQDDSSHSDDDASGRPPKDNDFDKVMTPVEFFEYIVTCIEDKDWEEFSFSFMCTNVIDNFLGTKSTKEEMLTEVQKDHDKLNKSRTVSGQCGDYSFCCSKEKLTKKAANKCGFTSRSRLELLTKHLSKSRQTIMEGMGKHEGVLDGNVDFVKTDPENPVRLFKSAYLQQDKEYAVVVAGESGAGKSCLAYLAAEKAQYTILYKSLSVEKTKTSGETSSTKKRKHIEIVGKKETLEEIVGNRYSSGAYPKLNQFLRHFICFFEATDPKHKNVEQLYVIKARLNVNRNAWAKEVLHQCIKDALIDDENQGLFNMWLAGRWSEEDKPKNLAIIIDDVVDTDLAKGLVSTVRETTELYSELAQDHVRLVIVGTGLDQIQYGHRVGTSPACSRLIVVQKPNVEKNLATDNKITQDQ